jgi:hypothetical protein
MAENDEKTVANPMLNTEGEDTAPAAHKTYNEIDSTAGYNVGWHTIRGMLSLHVSWSSDIARLHLMQLNKSQLAVALSIAFVYGTSQVARNAAVFSQAAFCTDTELEPRYSTQTSGIMVVGLGIGMGIGKGVWGPMVDKYDPGLVCESRVRTLARSVPA